jgi:hypothetical protein
MSQENVEVLRGVRHRLSLPSERAGQRRRLDERLFVRSDVALLVAVNALVGAMVGLEAAAHY